MKKGTLLLLLLVLFFSTALGQKISKDKASLIITDSLKGAKIESIGFNKGKNLYEANVSYEYKKLLVLVDGTKGKIISIQELSDPIFTHLKEIIGIIAPGEIIEKTSEKDENEITYTFQVRGKDKVLREIEITISITEGEEEEE